MSGIEIALAILPILGSAVTHYRDLIKPFSRYKTHAAEFRKLQLRLGTQRTIYHGEIRRLLARVLGDRCAEEMLLDCQHHASWTDVGVDNSLAEYLGPSLEAFVGMIETIKQSLQKFPKDLQDHDNPDEVSFTIHSPPPQVLCPKTTLEYDIHP